MVLARWRAGHRRAVLSRASAPRAARAPHDAQRRRRQRRERHAHPASRSRPRARHRVSPAPSQALARSVRARVAAVSGHATARGPAAAATCSTSASGTRRRIPARISPKPSRCGSSRIPRGAARTRNWPAFHKLELVDELMSERARPARAGAQSRGASSRCARTRARSRDHYRRKLRAPQHLSPRRHRSPARARVHGRARRRARARARARSCARTRRALVERRDARELGAERYSVEQILRIARRARREAGPVGARQPPRRAAACALDAGLPHAPVRAGRNSAPRSMKRLRTLVVMHATLVPPETLDGSQRQRNRGVAYRVRRRLDAARRPATKCAASASRQPRRAAHRHHRVEARDRLQPARGVRRHRHLRPARRRVPRAAAPAVHGLQSARPAAVARQAAVQAAARRTTAFPRRSSPCSGAASRCGCRARSSTRCS